MHSLLGEERAADGMTMSALSSYESACRLLNEVIVACLDEQATHRATAESTSARDLRAHLRWSAGRRADFAKELGTIVRALGGSPSAGGSTGEWFRAATLDFRGRLFGKSASRTTDACARVEARVDELYALAVKEGLPDRARAAVVRHHAELATDRATLRGLRESNAPA